VGIPDGKPTTSITSLGNGVIQTPIGYYLSLLCNTKLCYNFNNE